MNEVYCKDCGKMHTKDAEFYKNDADGTILCKKCFEVNVIANDQTIETMMEARKMTRREFIGYLVAGTLAIILGVSGAIALNMVM
jgi:hypothetical protein